ncbi:translation initiation factor IF-2 subunit gamma, partial [Candidatus Woesearchaeota archaeon CG_4_10_14_0_2_um_filter_57_5]
MAKKLGQPEISIGLVGHVDHGKTTLTERLSGKWTDTHSEEIKRGITIRLGYADLVIYKAEDGSLTTDEKKGKEAVRKISFVDAPGHESLMATMLCGATIIDGALLLIAANEPCPLPQTREHLTALEIIGVERVIVVQNKVDLVSPEDAKKNHQQIAAFLAETPYKDAPIIPISAQHGVNMDFLLQAIQDTFPTPKRDAKKEPLMFIARSFDINKPGTDPRKLQGGILGGALRQGVLKIGDTIGLSPGHMVVEKNKQIWKPLTTKITGITTGGEQVKQAGPGGSIGVMTELDPAVVKADSLTGCLVGRPDKLPP